MHFQLLSRRKHKYMGLPLCLVAALELLLASECIAKINSTAAARFLAQVFGAVVNV